ncbi:MAG: hypothetical protein ACI9TI_000408 [Natronomonas sp.]|jgi:hypothetical protein|uniref:hypothetical protein n=1 Tax=Natronomonas sp. TaxID=2184060 RepID=UPI003988FFAA
MDTVVSPDSVGLLFEYLLYLNTRVGTIAGSMIIGFPMTTSAVGFPTFTTLVFAVFSPTDLELPDREAYGFSGMYVALTARMAPESPRITETVRGI